MKNNGEIGNNPEGRFTPRHLLFGTNGLVFSYLMGFCCFF